MGGGSDAFVVPLLTFLYIFLETYSLEYLGIKVDICE